MRECVATCILYMLRLFLRAFRNLSVLARRFSSRACLYRLWMIGPRTCVGISLVNFEVSFFCPLLDFMGASFVIDHRNLWDVCVNSRCCVNLALRMCFDTSIISLNALASKHDLSTRQARRHQKTTAFCVVWQLRVIAETTVRMMQQTHTHGPIKMGCVIDYLMADETRQRLIIQCAKHLLPAQSIQAPHVCVGLREARFTLCYNGQDVRCVLPWMSSPMPMISTSASALNHGLDELRGFALCEKFNRLIKALSPQASDTARFRSLDGAGSMWRYMSDEIHLHKHVANKYHVGNHCCLHMNNLIATSVITTIFIEMHERLFTTCKYICMAGHYLRILYNCQTFVKTNADVDETTEPDADWARVANCLMGLLFLWHVKGCVFRCYVGEKPSWFTDLTWFFSIINCSLYVAAGQEPRVKHHCRGCCNSRGESMKKILVCLLRVALRCRPVIACLSRWLSFGPSLDFFLITIVVCKVASS